jgi:hypothetical protein
MADGIKINIDRRSMSGKFSLVLAREPRLQVCTPRIGLQVLVEMVESGKHVEVLVAGRGRESLRDLGRTGERFGRRFALQLWAEELMDEWAEVDFLACFERREKDVQA